MPVPEPQPAAAGAVVTAASDSSSPVRFVTDPNGRGFGYGLVARGGRALPAPAPPPPPPAALAPRITPPDQLERQPTLLDGDCRGYFPAQSTHDLGLVAAVALIQPSGALAKLDVESEAPIGQGFARAARECLQRQRFAPALDRRASPRSRARASRSAFRGDERFEIVQGLDHRIGACDLAEAVGRVHEAQTVA